MLDLPLGSLKGALHQGTPPDKPVPASFVAACQAEGATLGSGLFPLLQSCPFQHFPGSSGWPTD